MNGSEAITLESADLRLVVLLRKGAEDLAATPDGVATARKHRLGAGRDVLVGQLIEVARQIALLDESLEARVVALLLVFDAT